MILQDHYKVSVPIVLDYKEREDGSRKGTDGDEGAEKKAAKETD